MQILIFLLDNLFFVLVGAALLRAWMNQSHMRMTEQPGRFVMALSDWLVKPLRRALPNGLRQARLDWASLAAAPWCTGWPSLTHTGTSHASSARWTSSSEVQMIAIPCGDNR